MCWSHLLRVLPISISKYDQEDDVYTQQATPDTQHHVGVGKPLFKVQYYVREVDIPGWYKYQLKSGNGEELTTED